MKLFDVTKIPVLHRALDAYALRQKVIANNLANIATSGYRSKTVEFEEHLSSALRSDMPGAGTTNERHIPLMNDPGGDSALRIVDARSSNPLGGEDLASGVNDVDLDTEMAELAKNQLRFKFASRLIGESFRGLQKSIRGTV